jgi:hypothetical protein
MYEQVKKMCIREEKSLLKLKKYVNIGIEIHFEVEIYGSHPANFHSYRQ